MLATQLLHVIPEMCRKHFATSLPSPSLHAWMPSSLPSNTGFCPAVLRAPRPAAEHDGSLLMLSNWHDTSASSSASVHSADSSYIVNINECIQIKVHIKT